MSNDPRNGSAVSFVDLSGKRPDPHVSDDTITALAERVATHISKNKPVRIDGLTFKSIGSVLSVVVLLGGIIWGASAIAADKATHDEVQLGFKELQEKIEVIDRSVAKILGTLEQMNGK